MAASSEAASAAHPLRRRTADQPVRSAAGIGALAGQAGARTVDSGVDGAAFTAPRAAACNRASADPAESRCCVAKALEPSSAKSAAGSP
jgi:hypothetical protein